MLRAALLGPFSVVQPRAHQKKAGSNRVTPGDEAQPHLSTSKMPYIPGSSVPDAFILTLDNIKFCH